MTFLATLAAGLQHPVKPPSYRSEPHEDSWFPAIAVRSPIIVGQDGHAIFIGLNFLKGACAWLRFQRIIFSNGETNGPNNAGLPGATVLTV